jgi:beta-lactamase superfamily II metal-dependent hydrolase
MQANQQFSFEEDPAMPGYYSIRAAHSGKVLDISGGSAYPGAKVIQWDKKPSGANLNQLWRLEYHNAFADEPVSFISALDNTFALDISGGLDSNGVDAVVWPYAPGKANQSFAVIKPNGNVTPPSSYVLPDGIYALDLASSPGFSLDIAQASLTQGAQLISWYTSSQINQLFYIARVPSGSYNYYMIIALGSGMSLDVERNNRVVHTSVLQWPYSGQRNQLWVLDDGGGGNVFIRSQSSGFALTASVQMQGITMERVGSSGGSMSPSAAQLFTPRLVNSQELPPLLLTTAVCFKPQLNPGMRIDIANGSREAGAAAITWPDNGGNNQKFEVFAAGGGKYAIRSVFSGLYLADSSSKVVQGSPASGGALPTDPAQLWTVRLGMGGYSFTNVASGRNLSSSGQQGSPLTTTAGAFDQDQLFYVTATPVSTTKNLYSHTDALDMRVSVIYVGQAEAILIESEGHVMLVDAGLPESGATVVDYLRAQGIVEIDYLVATHPHIDHIGGMPAVLAAFDVENNVLAPDRSHSTATYRRFVAAVEMEPGVGLEKPSVGRTYQLGDAVFEILSNGDGAESLNDASIVIKVYCGSKTLLLTGDIEAATERSLVNSGRHLQSDVLSVPHHGSHTSSTAVFLNAVRPQIAVVSCGYNNEYGHPHQSVVNRLQSIGAQIYRTDRSGTIVVDFADDWVYARAA